MLAGAIDKAAFSVFEPLNSCPDKYIFTHISAEVKVTVQALWSRMLRILYGFGTSLRNIISLKFNALVRGHNFSPICFIYRYITKDK